MSKHNAGRWSLDVTSHGNSFWLEFDHNGSVIDRITAFGSINRDIYDLHYLLSRAIADIESESKKI